MKAFQALFDQLDSITSTRAKVSLLADYFRRVPSADSAWALSLLVGKRRRRLITGRRLRDILRDQGGMPEWLINDCDAVGDSAKPSVCCGRGQGSNQRANQSYNNPLTVTGGWKLYCQPSQDKSLLKARLCFNCETIPEPTFHYNKLLTGGFV